MTIRIRTSYSFRNAVGKVNDVLDKLEQMGMSHAPITDTASTFGYAKWNKEARKRGMVPVFGVELAVTANLHESKPVADPWTFIAGHSLKPLHALISKATEQFRYQPMITIDQALGENCFVIMGHRSKVLDIEPRPGLYVGVGPSTPVGQFRRILKSGHPIVATSDNRYIHEGDMSIYETACGRGASTQTYPQWIMDDAEWFEYCVDKFGAEHEYLLQDAIDRRDDIFDLSTASLQPAEMVHPPRPASLLEMCREGAQALGVDLEDPIYQDRLNRELALISEKNFDDYFYLVADICKWARARMIVGPARGSSCGSLVCYLLRITSIDPIPYGLIFERFIDINRDDMPDIDIDFPQDRRDEVFEYVAQTYGRERVARLGTVNMYQPTSAIKETAGAMDIKPWFVDPVVAAFEKTKAGDSLVGGVIASALLNTPEGKKFFAEYPEILVATNLEGLPKHAGQHAAGIVITENPVTDYVAVDQRTGATMCDKRDAEDLNLLKIDALGLTQLSVFEKALELAGLDRDHLFSIDLNDQKALDVLNSGRFAGVFQFNGYALQNITKEVSVDSLHDIVAITALARPGPLAAGGTAHWIKVKQGEAREQYPHPIFEPILRDTVGVITYQEQVMKICREVGNMSWSEVTALRKAMSKTLGAEAFNEYGDKWKAGARENGVPEDVLDRVWAEMVAYGSYAFNLSHAVAYGVVSYWCCWMKAHYPVEFAAATLTYTDSKETQLSLLRELAVEGVNYIPADIDVSTDSWAVKREGAKRWLVGPLSNVKGVGPKMVATILGARQRGEPVPERARKLLSNPKTEIDSLYPISDAFKRIMEDPTKFNIITKPTQLCDVEPTGNYYDVVVFVTASRITARDLNEERELEKRKGQIRTGQTKFLDLRLNDDTGEIFARINERDYERIGADILENAKVGKTLFAIKGSVPRSFRMLSVSQVKTIGVME